MCVGDIVNHPALRRLEEIINLDNSCGYVSMLKTGAPKSNQSSISQSASPKEKTKPGENEEISEFLDDLKELGLGDLESPKSNLDKNLESKQVSKPKNEDSSAVPCDTLEQLTEAESKLMKQWVPFEMFYGIPLFSKEVNHSVCDKVNWP